MKIAKVSKSELARLVRAVDEADEEAVHEILKRNRRLARENVPFEGDSEQTLLHRAIPSDGCPLSTAQFRIIRILLKAEADPNALGWGANNGYCTPVTMAAWGGHVRIVNLLLANGGDADGVQHPVYKGTVPIDAAADHGHSDAVEALIVEGAGFRLDHLLKADLYFRAREIFQDSPGAARYHRPERCPPLHAAVQSGSSRMVGLVLEYGCRIGCRDRLGRTALQFAIEEQRGEAAEYLLQQGARVDLFAAAGFGDAGQVKRMLSRDRSRALVVQKDGMSALHYPAWSGSIECVQLLLAAGAPVSPRAKRLWACLTPLHAALKRGHRDVVRLLVDRGADLDAFDAEPGRYWPTPLHAAARWGSLEDVEYLLNAGADPNGGVPVPDTMDPGPLSWAIATSNVPLLRLLLDHGLDLQRERFQGALQQAGEHGNKEMIALLREAARL